jgi:hypothetical protein
MCDQSNSTFILLITLLIFILGNGTLGIILLAKTHLHIPLLLFTIFEWLNVTSAVLAAYLLKIESQHHYIKTFMIFSLALFMLASTVLGIYWIDDIELGNVHAEAIDIRQLTVSLITIFILSLIPKAFLTYSFLIKGTSQSIFEDIEAAIPCDVLNPSSSNPSSKSDGSHSNTIIHSGEEKETKHASFSGLLNSHLAKVMKLPYKNEHSDVTDNDTTPNMLFQNLSMPNLPLKQSQILRSDQPIQQVWKIDDLFNAVNSTALSDVEDTSLSMINNSKFHFPPLKDGETSNFHPVLSDHLPSQMEGDDDYRIQMLNISELPQSIHEPTFNHDRFSSMGNLSPRDEKWFQHSKHELKNHGSNSNELDLDLYPKIKGAVSVDHSNDSLNTVPKGNNMLVEELSKEIQQNDTHLRNQHSMPNIPVTQKRSFSLKRRESTFSRALRGSISSSAIGHMAVKSLFNSTSMVTSHGKTNSASTSSIAKSKSQSPLKKIMNIKDSISQIDLNRSSFDGYDNQDDVDFDLHLAYALRNSPKKKQSIKSFSSKKSVRKFASFSSLHNEKVSADFVFDISNIEDESFDVSINSSDKINKYCNKLLSELSNPGGNRVFSGMDKSTVSTNSVPSGYYGEYDKEKWKVIKRTANNEASQAQNVTITETIPAELNVQ